MLALCNWENTQGAGVLHPRVSTFTNGSSTHKYARANKVAAYILL